MMEMEMEKENGMECKEGKAKNLLEMMKAMASAEGETVEEEMGELGEQGEPKMDEKALQQLAKMLKLKAK